MRTLIPVLMISLLTAFGCGGSDDATTDETGNIETATANDAMPDDAIHGMPADDVHASAMNEAMGGGMHGGGGGINAEITLAPEIADDWRAVKVRLIELATMDETFHEVPIGGSAALGDSGLTFEAVAFIPDFVMDETGITSRSAEPQNPAVRIVVFEEGKDDYTGWLFGAMPEIHAFPHETYGLTLVEGVRAE